MHEKRFILTLCKMHYPCIIRNYLTADAFVWIAECVRIIVIVLHVLAVLGELFPHCRRVYKIGIYGCLDIALAAGDDVQVL